MLHLGIILQLQLVATMGLTHVNTDYFSDFAMHQIKPAPESVVIVASAGTRITWQTSPVNNPYQVNNARFGIINTISNYGSGFPNGEMSGRYNSAPVTCRASIIPNASSPSPVQLTFGGQNSVTINDGQMVWTDAYSSLPASNWYFRIEFTTTIANQALPVITGANVPANIVTVTGTDILLSNSLSQTDNGNSQVLNVFGIRGTPVSPSNAKFQTNRFGVVGDSILESGGGYLDTTLSTSGLAYFLMAQAGHALFDYTSRPDKYMSARQAMLFSMPQCIFEWGVNDLRNGATFATLKASVQSFCSVYRQAGGKRVILMVPTPLTSSTDGWTTAANQTEIASPYWDQYVAWLRGNPANDIPGLQIIVIDAGSFACDTVITNVWKAGCTDDGIHPNSTGYSAIRSGVTSPLVTALNATF